MWQLRAIEENLEGGYTNMDSAQICDKILEAGFPREYEKRLMDSLRPWVVSDETVKLQNYTSILNFIDSERLPAWKQCEENHIPLFSKVAEFCLALGLTSPSCPTYATIAAILEWIKSDGSRPLKTVKEDKQKVIKELKLLFEDRIANMQKVDKPAMRLAILPQDPQIFFKRYPVLSQTMITINVDDRFADAESVRTYASTFPLRDRTSTMQLMQMKFDTQQNVTHTIQDFCTQLFANQMKNSLCFHRTRGLTRVS